MNRLSLQSMDAEQMLLSCLLTDNSKWSDIKNQVEISDFYEKRHQIIFRSLRNLLEAHNLVEVLTLTEEMKKTNQLEEVGGEVYLFELANRVLSTNNITAYVKIIRERSLQRKAIAFCKQLLKDITKLSLNDIEKKFKAIAQEIQCSQSAGFELESSCLSYEDLLRRDIPERKLLLPFLPQGGLGMVFAPRGLGKTLFSISLAVAITSSNKFMGWNVGCNCGVLYVDGEMSLEQMRERITNFCPTMPINPLSLLSHEVFYDEFEYDLSVTNEKTQFALLKLLDHKPDIKLLVLDNLSCLSKIREDKSDDWRTVMLPFLIACRRRGVAVLLVHHAGKSGDQRGTGAREDALDVSIKLSPMPDSKNDGAYFRVDIVKSRGCRDGDATKPFTAKLSHSENAGFYWEIQSVEESTKDRMINLITDAGDDGISAKDIAEELNISVPMVSRYKKQLETEGVILRCVGKTTLRINSARQQNA